VCPVDLLPPHSDPRRQDADRHAVSSSSSLHIPLIALFIPPAPATPSRALSMRQDLRADRRQSGPVLRRCAVLHLVPPQRYRAPPVGLYLQQPELRPRRRCSVRDCYRSPHAQCSRDDHRPRDVRQSHTHELWTGLYQSAGRCLRGLGMWGRHVLLTVSGQPDHHTTPHHTTPHHTTPHHTTPHTTQNECGIVSPPDSWRRAPLKA
jgi:hypothetical protein